MTYEELKKEAELQGYRLIKSEPYVRFKVCTCGNNKRRLWHTPDGVLFQCTKCGKEASGKNERQAKLNWNKMIEEELNEINKQ